MTNSSEPAKFFLAEFESGAQTVPKRNQHTIFICFKSFPNLAHSPRMGAVALARGQVILLIKPRFIWAGVN